MDDISLRINDNKNKKYRECPECDIQYSDYKTNETNYRRHISKHCFPSAY